MAGTLNRGEVRLFRFASPDKRRPVLVLTRDSAMGHLATVTVAPITSTVRGVPSEVILDIEEGMKGLCAVNLHHAVTVAQSRVGRHRGGTGFSLWGGCGFAFRAELRLRIDRWTQQIFDELP